MSAVRRTMAWLVALPLTALGIILTRSLVPPPGKHPVGAHEHAAAAVEEEGRATRADQGGRTRSLGIDEGASGAQQRDGQGPGGCRGWPRRALLFRRDSSDSL